MRGKKLTFLVVAILIIFCVASYAETKKLKVIGRYPLIRIKGQVPTAEVMKIMLDKYAGDIKYGFDMAGYGDLYIPFMEKLKTAEFSETTVPVGETFYWMLFRSKGAVKIVKDLEWAGEAALPVFSFKLTKNYKHYTIVMPKPCGNISLLKIEDAVPDAVCNLAVSPNKANINDPISVDMSGSQHAKSMEVVVTDSEGNVVATKALTPDSPRWQVKLPNPGEYSFKGKAMNMEGKVSTNPCDAKVYINAPPTCQLFIECLTCLHPLSQPIFISANDSSDPDGQVVKANFEIRDSAGTVVDTYMANGQPLRWEKTFEKAGIYTVSGFVTDDFGAVSTPCQALEVKIVQKKLYFLVEGGPMLVRGTWTAYAFGRIGLFYKIVPDRFSFTLAAGPAFPLSNTPEFKTFFMVNALVNLHTGPAFFGAGLGYAGKSQADRKAGLDVVGQIGYDLFNNYSNIGSIFFEGRIPVGSERPFKEDVKFALGFRYVF